MAGEGIYERAGHLWRRDIYGGKGHLWGEDIYWGRDIYATRGHL